MANSDTSKIRLIAIYRMLESGNKYTSAEILQILDYKYGITADRKTIYNDIAAIDRFLPIEIIAGRNGGYRLWDVLGGVEDGQQG